MKSISALRPARLRLLAASMALCLAPATLAAERFATGDDGREILLKADGTWEYRSTDRFATSADGTRVRLKDNGRWEFIGNAPKMSDASVQTEALAVTLTEIVTEFNKQKVAKNTRYNSETTFHLTVKVSAYAEQAIAAKLGHHNLFKVTDSNGNQYPILDVNPQPKQLQPGEEYSIAVRVDGSPAGQFATGIKFLYLEIEPAVFGSADKLKFTRRTDDIKSVRNGSLR